MRRSKGEVVFSVFNTIFMIFMIVITLYPMYYCIIASFSDPVKLSLNPGFILLPMRPLTIRAYEKVLSHSLFKSGVYNTIFVVTVGTTLNMILTIITGYALSRKGFMLKTPITFFIVFTMYFSGGLIPAYLNVKSFGLLNSLWALIVPGAINTYNMIIMRTAFTTVPESLAESAQMDGAKHITILFRIMVPLSKPTIAVLILYYAVGHWNAWFNAFIYLQEPTKYPLQLVMRNILRSVDVSEMLVDIGGEDHARYVELIKYALIVVSTVPILVLYPFLQKYFVKGIMIGAIKG